MSIRWANICPYFTLYRVEYNAPSIPTASPGLYSQALGSRSLRHLKHKLNHHGHHSPHCPKAPSSRSPPNIHCLPDIRSRHFPVLPHLPFPYVHHHRSESYPPSLVQDLQESRRRPHRHTLPLSIITSATNIYFSEAASSGAKSWYWRGLLFTVGNVLYGRWALRLMNAIVEDELNGACLGNVKEWLGMNLVRGLTVEGQLG